MYCVCLQADQEAAARSQEVAGVRRTLEEALAGARRDAEKSRAEVLKVGYWAGAWHHVVPAAVASPRGGSCAVAHRIVGIFNANQSCPQACSLLSPRPPGPYLALLTRKFCDKTKALK